MKIGSIEQLTYTSSDSPTHYLDRVLEEEGMILPVYKRRFKVWKCITVVLGVIQIVLLAFLLRLSAKVDRNAADGLKIDKAMSEVMKSFDTRLKGFEVF